MTYSDPEQYPDYSEETYDCDMCDGNGEIATQDGWVECPQCCGEGILY